jgi:regulator of sigma E protease
LENIVLFVLLIGGLIFFHELGHFIVARLCRVRVLQFSIGFGPELYSFTRNDTEYRIGALPLGGYVRMLGMDPSDETEGAGDEDSFQNKSLWQRIAIVFAGPAFNLILPFFVFFGLFLTASEIQPAIVGSVEPDGVASRAGLASGDRITSIDGEKVEGWWDLLRVVSASADKEITMTVERDGNELEPVAVTPARVNVSIDSRLNVSDDVGRIQVSLQYIKPDVIVARDGLAWQAGLRSWDRILAINGQPVERWVVANRVFNTSQGPITVSYVRGQELPEEVKGTGGLALAATLPAQTITIVPDGKTPIGVRSAEWTVHDVEPDSPASKAGLQPGDEILGLLQPVTGDLKQFSMWGLLIRDMADRKEQTHSLRVRRGDEIRTISLRLEERIEITEFKTEQPVIVFGAANRSGHGAPEREANEARFSYAAWRTWSETTDLLALTVAGLGGLFTGKVQLKEMGGPIFMYQLASKTSERGISYFFQIMAMLSISLGLINLLPIPLLDGGHLLFFLIEAIKRQPVSLRTRQVASYLGFSAIILLMVLVFKNDLERIWFVP